MMKFLILLILSTSFVFAGPREEAQNLIDRMSGETSITKKMELFSQHFLGRPYNHQGPLGEGPEGRFDQDPLYRFDTFDCTTFVETITALALSRDVNEFETHINNIRYESGEVNFLKRNHFTDLEWIPNNTQNGYLKEINTLVSNHILTARALIDFPNWLRTLQISTIQVPMISQNEKEALLEELHNESSNFVSRVAEVPYLSINELVKNPSLLERIPTATIVNFVRPNWDLTDIIGTHQNISHQGFLFRKGSVLYLRHASSAGEQRVTELPFLDYLRKYVNHPTLKGIHLMQVIL